MTFEQLKEKYEGKYLIFNDEGYMRRPWEPSGPVILITNIIRDTKFIYDTQISYINEDFKEMMYNDHFKYIIKWIQKYDIVP